VLQEPVALLPKQVSAALLRDLEVLVDDTLT
jgi:hypothetical protein